MNKQNLSHKDLLVITQANKGLIDFSIAINPTYKPNWHHEIVAEELEKIVDGSAEWKILMLLMPPRHGKSEEATINFPAWYLGKCPDKEIITASYSAELAEDFGGKTREYVESQEYQKIFNTTLKSDEKSKGKWKTNKGGSYTSAGVGGPITGRGANVLIIDDPIKNREEAESEVIRNKHWNWFTSTAFTRLEPNGKVVVILTRWNQDDLVGRILNNEELAKQTKVIRFPALADKDEKHRKQGQALWPQRFNENDLESIKRSIGPYDWSSLYQQTPISSENQEFKKEWFQYKHATDVERANTRKFLTVDTAMSKESGADYSGFCENYVDAENNWNLRAYRMRLSPKELVDYLFKVYNDKGFELIGIEKTTYTWGLKPYIEEECKKRNKFLPIVELEHKQRAKDIRIRGLIPRYSSYSIYHISGECHELEEELIQFPNSLHDDISDATAYQLQIALKPNDTDDEFYLTKTDW